jgi:hypothetical protein
VSEAYRNAQLTYVTFTGVDGLQGRELVVETPLRARQALILLADLANLLAIAAEEGFVVQSLNQNSTNGQSPDAPFLDLIEDLAGRLAMLSGPAIATELEALRRIGGSSCSRRSRRRARSRRPARPAQGLERPAAGSRDRPARADRGGELRHPPCSATWAF